MVFILIYEAKLSGKTKVNYLYQHGTTTIYIQKSNNKYSYDITLDEMKKLAASAPLAFKVMLGSKKVVKEF